MRSAQLLTIATVALMAAACTTEIFSDSDPVTYSQPPEARNECEAAFLDELTADIGIALSPPPTPETDALVQVMNACDFDELLAADEYLSYGVGQTFTRLTAHHLFNGPDRADQLARLCESEPYRSTLACETIEAAKPSG